MSNRAYMGAALCAALAVSLAAPAHAAGEIIITQAKALAGNVTPGDTPGYPIKLTVPGSYVLGSNLDVPVGNTGIQIFADDVTIDLSGYRLFGNGQSAAFGIVGAAGRARATIRNGTIAEFKFDGINGSSANWIVENIRVVDKGRVGILVAFNYTTVRGSTATRNGNTGISCGLRCLVEGSNSSDNGAQGISIGGGTVLGNVLVGNDGFGIEGHNVTGSGNNTLSNNNGGGAQISGVTALHPNACSPACP